MVDTIDARVFEFAGNRLTYRVFGNGPAVLLAFHGFGQTSEVFKPLETVAEHPFTVVAIDIFFHGGSFIAGSRLVTATIWQKLLEQFLLEQAIDRFSLVGFSMGGRFALVTADLFADRVDQLILIAPDGITRSVWYRTATTTAAGRIMFRYFLRHMPVLNAIGHFLTTIGLLNRTAMRFAELSLRTPEQRRLVYQVWTQFRLIRPNLERIAEKINQHSIATRFFTGAFDRIVPGQYILPLTKRLRQYELSVLATGHNRLIELAADQLP